MIKSRTSIKRVLSRAKLFFPSIFLFFAFSLVSSVYAGWKSGEIQEKVIEPVKQSAVNFKQSLEKLGEASSSLPPTASLRPSPKGESNPRGGQPASKGQSAPSVTQPTQQQDQDEWFRQVQEANQQLSEESKRKLEEFKAESERNLEEFKQEGKQGLEEWRKEQEEAQAKFREEHGF